MSANIKMKNYKIKTSFVSLEGLKVLNFIIFVIKFKFMYSIQYMIFRYSWEPVLIKRLFHFLWAIYCANVYLNISIPCLMCIWMNICLFRSIKHPYAWCGHRKWFLSCKLYSCLAERERGQWAVYYTSPQSFIITFSYSLAYQLWGLYWILICWFIKLSVQVFQPII